jgi:carboxyl-terminal processing protease
VIILKKTVLKILSYVLVAVIASGTTVACFLFAQRDRSTKLREVENLLQQYFIGDVDTNKLEDAAASAMVSALGDRWSYYMTAEQYKNYQDTMTNSYVGIGITIQVREDGTGFEIVSVIEGSPAKEKGLLAGDLLIAVDGTDVTKLDANALTPLVRGEENTNVKLTVLRDGEKKEFTITRKRFQSPVATHKMLEGQIGLITIENFDQRCAQETIAAIEALTKQGAKALIFDVRNNPGGYKDEMIKVLDYLLPEGPLFRSVDYRGKEVVEYSDARHLDIPMAVLVNLSSYSAAEFFAAALEEYDAAITVGEKTFGKGYFQTTFPLRDGSAVNLSIGKYTTPKGVSLADVGLTPKVTVPVDEATAAKIYAGTLAPEEDPQIIAAINALKS